ncbi:sensor domain-containing protein [Bowmanella dokdonensis]|uniref:Sensor protein FixL n=1 Tax=Bowmanella dokdonensis TaxID=751969 RepID=A0A939IPZ6_9ALTE|nr:EAL domain-containing protein [Bowmanella dokdonensis]MBN7823951.1 EAL domain-containing protein [Bowmanella dokdonensis]
MLPIQNSDALLSSLMDAAVDAVIIINGKGLILYFSDAACSLFDYRKEQVLGSNVSILMPAYHASRHDDYIEDYKQTGEAKIIGIGREVEGRRQDGSLFPMRLSVGEARSEGQRYFIGICHDLTEQRALEQSVELARSVNEAILDAAADAIISIDGRGRVLAFNQSAERIFGYHKDEVLGKNVSMLMPDIHAERHDQYLRDYQQGGESHIIGVGRDLLAVKKGGKLFPIYINVGEVKGQKSPIYVAVCHDLTELQQLLKNLSHAEARYQNVVEHQRELVCRLDRDLRFTFINIPMRSSFCNGGEGLGMSLLEYVSPDQRKTLRVLLVQLIEQGGGEVAITVNMQPQRTRHCWVDWTFSLVMDQELTEVQGLGLDVTEQQRAKQHAQFLSRFDQLTGLLNRHGCRQEFEQLCSQYEQVALMFFDTNRFRWLDERFGTDVGDLLQMEVAYRIKSMRIPALVAARSGPDDFVLCFPLSENQHALELAHQVIGRLEAPYRLAGEELNISVNLGIALWDRREPVDFSTQVRNAGSAMHQARQRQSRVALYDSGVQKKLRRAMELELGIKRALSQDLFEIYLQPKYRLDTEELDGFEALLRWQDPQLGRVAPDEFIHLAEQAGLGKALDRWVIEKVASLLKSWPGAHKEGRIAVNITSQHLADPGLVEHILDCLTRYQVPRGALELEITEGMAMDASAEVLSNIAKLKKLDIKLALDDFGTGYSSLSYLDDLDLDYLKIDKRFIDALDGKTSHNLVEAIIRMAKALDMTVIAEGVESKKQLQTLRELGCDKVQGYVFSKPLPIREARRLLKGA